MTEKKWLAIRQVDRDGDSEWAVAFKPYQPFEGPDIYKLDEGTAHLIAAAPELVEALEDALSGLRYIRQSYGDLLYGVGWDRVEEGANAALAKAYGEKN